MRRALIALGAALTVISGVVLVLPASGPAPRRALADALPDLRGPLATTPRVTVGPAVTVPPPTASTALAPPTTSPAVYALALRLNAVLVNTNSCLVVADGATGATLYRHQPDRPMAPASTQKLLVAAAALDRLGPDFRFTTTVVAARRPVRGEVDDLWLVGGGDPVLASPEYTTWLLPRPLTRGAATTPLAALVPALVQAGVRTVPGGIHGDDSRYDRTRFLPTWPSAYGDEGDIGPLGALEVDDGLDRWDPRLVDTADPAAHAAGVLARLLGASGVVASQGPDGVAPAGGVVLASVPSPPLSQLVAAMLRSSDNMTAELLTRELDHQAGGAGTTAGGAAIVRLEAARLGLPVAGLHLVDGSGLDPGDRASCSTLLAALDLGDRAGFAPLATGLARAGRSGTLVNRLLGTPAAGHLAAKTGSIEGVNAIVGRLDEGHPLRFALIANGSFGYGVGVGVEDRVIAALGTYPGG